MMICGVDGIITGALIRAEKRKERLEERVSATTAVNRPSCASAESTFVDNAATASGHEGEDGNKKIVHVKLL